MCLYRFHDPDADSSLAESECVQSSGVDGYVCPGAGFCGNDLVNFIGVPLAGYSSYIDLMAQGGTTTTDTFLMFFLARTGTDTLVFPGRIGAGDGDCIGYI